MSPTNDPFVSRIAGGQLADGLRIDFWDVGQGDASVLTLNDGSLVIVDVGDLNSPLPDWLKARPNKRIAGIAITHNDSDHAGALADILDACAARIDNLWLLLDRNPQDDRFKLLFYKAYALHRQGKLKLHNLQSTDIKIPLLKSLCGKLQLNVLYPDFAATLGTITQNRPNPNNISAILALEILNETKIIWTGDAPMSAVANICANHSPIVIVGPHHGAPVDRKLTGYKQTFSTPKPEVVFISVGAANKYDHPTFDFINNHSALGRQVVCSQLRHCDRKKLLNKTHVLHSHLALGLLPPYSRNAVTCRGPMQLTLSCGELIIDRFHEEHKRELSNLQRPQCLKKFSPASKP